MIAWATGVASLAQGLAGIPEPDLVWYGKVSTTIDGAPVRLTSGMLAWRIEPLAGGPPIVVSTPLTNLNSQFSFALRVPCESPEPAVSASTNVVNLTVPPRAYRRLSVTLDGQPLALVGAASDFSPALSDRGRTERLDLRLGSASVDADGDGLADAWEMLHFGSLNATPAADPDGDGVDNLHEFRAGTDPLDAASRFEIVEISATPGGPALQWTSQANHTYRVRRAASLLAPASEYVVVRSSLAATPPLNQFIDSTAGTSGLYFYRIEIEE